MVFASSDHSNASLHPKLDICYSSALSISENLINNIGFNIFPNPTSNFVELNLNSFQSTLHSIDIINSSGRLIKHISDYKTNTPIDLLNLSKGLYFVKVYSENIISLKKLIIE